MTKRELIAKIAETADLDLLPVEAVLNGLGKVAAAALAAGDAVPMPRLGKLKPKYREGRIVTNPRNHMRISIPAGTTVKFAAGQELKDALRG